MNSIEPGRNTVAVLGAGPVGSLLSLYLARRGFLVDLYESRPDIRRQLNAGGRSINLNLTVRGIEALERASLAERVLREAVPMTGRSIHPRTGPLAYQPYGRHAGEHGNSVSRTGLNRMLLDHAETTGRVRLHFHARVRDFDVASGVAHVEDTLTGERRAVRADTFFATDGSGSAVREALQRQSGFECSIAPLDYGYKELLLPADTAGRPRIEQNVLHIWPRGTYMLIALPNLDGSFTCTLFLPLQGPQSFASLSDAAAVRQYFESDFPDFAGLMPDLEASFLAHPTGHMETVRCHPWHTGGKLLLLGDAAHAVVPFYGQGMNAGFEDVSVLDHCLESRVAGAGAGDDAFWTDVFSEMTALRKPNTDAIADMAVENFIEMRDKCADARFLMERAVEKILEKRFPGEYLSRYTLVTFTTVPYALAQRAGRINEEILSELCRGLSRPEAVDLERAAELIKMKLSPVLHGPSQAIPADAATARAG